MDSLIRLELTGQPIQRAPMMTEHGCRSRRMQKPQGKGVGGIDVEKDWHYVQWLDANGPPVGKADRFTNSRAGFDAVWERRPTAAVRVGMELTGHDWPSLAHWLSALGAEVVLVQPAPVHRLKELDDNTPTKSDAKDARVIARLVQDGRYFRWEPRTGAWAQLATWIAGRIHQDFPEFRAVFKAWDGKSAVRFHDARQAPKKVRHHFNSAELRVSSGPDHIVKQGRPATQAAYDARRLFTTAEVMPTQTARSS